MARSSKAADEGEPMAKKHATERPAAAPGADKRRAKDKTKRTLKRL